VRQTEFGGGAGLVAGEAAGGWPPDAAGLAGGVVANPAEAEGDVVESALDWAQAASAIAADIVSPLIRAG
jgi:hypothetical protein